MMGFRRPLFVAIVCGLAVALSAHPGVRGAEAQPAESGRIVAVGDIHGAADEFAGILQTAGLIDAKRRWIGGRARLVQTGDYLDRGAQVRAVLDLLMRLEEDARRAGGRVEVLLGNHEGMNLLREIRDVSPQAYAAFADGRSESRRDKAFEAHQTIAKNGGAALDRDVWMRAHPPGYVEYAEALGPGGKYGRWLRSRKVVIKADGTIFMHAGIRPDFPGTIDDVNRNVERELRAWDAAVAALERAGLIEPFFDVREIVAAAGLEVQRIVSLQQAKKELPDYVTRDFVESLQHLAAIDSWSLLTADGPLWYRGYATLPEEALPQVDEALKRHGASRFVLGHTPQVPGRIASRLGGRVFLIDTGMLSTHYKGGRASALELQDGRIAAIYSDGRETLKP
jgi:hypothetical protein